ncbi:MAG: GNAT family N-acetyltransferase [Verrucomicrobia bacterium]|nr:GNAT family N-acetyltransferase [Verrucomicrobiota bacterium]
MACKIDKSCKTARSEGSGTWLVEDFSIFKHCSHPRFGPITTDFRKTQIDTLAKLSCVKPRRLWHFVAGIKGEPLGSATLCVQAGVAGIYDVGVLGKARGEGLGTAVVQAALRFAGKMDCRVAVVQATAQGGGLYRRLGFGETCKIKLWHYAVD